MRAGRPARTALLAVLYAVSGLLCAFGALMPLARTSPVTLLWTLAAMGLAGAAAIWVMRTRLPEPAVHGAVLLETALLGVLAWRSATAVGIVGLGPIVIAIGLYAAQFFSLRDARLHVAALIASFSLGAIGAAPAGFLVPWVTLIVATALLTELQGRVAAQLRSAAATDPLTGVANRRAWEDEAERHLARAVRTGEPLTFVLLDLDNFKEVNDRLGHSAGDALLRDLAVEWSTRLRKADLLGRYGGDEFVLCLPATDAVGTQEILERLQASHPFAWSAGVAAASGEDTLASVLGRADEELYRQKRSRTA
jgi:diguanylate cyclase (GGDEF)-like protein